MPDLEAYFRGLADKTRLRIVNLLLAGELCVCDIQRILRASQSGVSRHLTYLKHAGLVQDVRNGTRVVYSLTPADTPQLEALREFLHKACPAEEVLQSDLRSFECAVREGRCRLGGKTLRQEGGTE
jgi:ArsR family transcriptional regulator